MSDLRSLARCSIVAALLLAGSFHAAAGAEPAPQPLSASVPDGAGGTIVVWSGLKSGTNFDLYAQRLNAAGARLWADLGVAVSTAADRQINPQVVTDGAGGAIVTWLDYRSGSAHVYAQRLDAAGAPQWTPDGVALCTAASFQAAPQLVSDGAGGAIVAWEDFRGSSRDVYARRVDAGGAPQWNTNGVALCTAVRDQITPQIVSDSAGGAIVAWSDARSGVDNDIYAQRVSAAGAPLWNPDGVPICVAAGSQHHPRMAADGAGGATAAWEDRRNTIDYDIYAQAFDADGAPRWDADGVALCAASRDQLAPGVVADGAGSAIVTWEDYRAGSFSESDIYARRVNAAGVPLWDADGVALCGAQHGQTSPQVLADGAGGALVAWSDGRGGFNDDIYAQQVDSSGVALWTADGVALCTAPGDQLAPQIGSDGAGGAVVSWSDERSTTDDDLYAQRVSAGVTQWAADGAAVHIEPGVQRLPAACPDGGTGVYVAWQEKRGPNYDIALRRFDAGGGALWPALVVCGAPNAQVNAIVAPDGTGGAIVTWMDYRNGTDSDAYVQRVNAAGVPQWTAGGVAVSQAPYDQINPRLVSDGAGGAVAAWADGRNGTDYDIFVQRVDGAGVPLWTGDGVALCTTSGNQLNPQIVADASGGAIVAWQDLRAGGVESDVYARRVDAAGTQLWALDGVALCTVAGAQRFPTMTVDGAGGAIVAWEDRRGASADIYAGRVDAAGATPWTLDGVALCTAANTQDNPQIVPDGAGGAIVAWRDGRGGPNYDVYARRVDAAGAPQWTLNGVALCTAAAVQDRPRIASDGAGGAIVAWEDHRNAITDTDVYAQRADATGAPQWSAGGVALCTAPGPQMFPAIAADGAGGAFVAWADHRDGIEDFAYLQRIDSGGAPVFASDGVTPTLVSLASAEAWPGRVRLVWYAAGGAGLVATVERATRAGGWSTIASLVADGTGRLTCEDLAAAPGERLGYRLGWRESGVEHHSAETWVDVPRAPDLALRAVGPNPARDALWVTFSLARRAPATLGLYDIAGRQVRLREVGDLGPGEWQVNLGEGRPLPAGVYVVRLSQEGRSLARRVVVTP
jgi:hypothetical protein